MEAQILLLLLLPQFQYFHCALRRADAAATARSHNSHCLAADPATTCSPILFSRSSSHYYSCSDCCCCSCKGICPMVFIWMPQSWRPWQVCPSLEVLEVTRCMLEAMEAVGMC